MTNYHIPDDDEYYGHTDETDGDLRELDVLQERIDDLEMLLAETYDRLADLRRDLLNPDSMVGARNIAGNLLVTLLTLKNAL